MLTCQLLPRTSGRPMPSTAVLPAVRRDHQRPPRSDGGMEIADVNPLGRKGVPGVGARIRAARHRAGWTIDELAERSGFDPSSLTQWEGGGRDLFVRHLVKLAAVFDMPVESFLPGAPLPPPRVLAGALECPNCGTECAVLVTAMAPQRHPHEKEIQR
jgi:transcriptional regulator with XRE-family HTH domain